MIKKVLFLTALMLLCSSCVSRTVIGPSGLSGSEKEVVKEKKLIWFWQEEFSN
jgi:hypothetical protein